MGHFVTALPPQRPPIPRDTALGRGTNKDTLSLLFRETPKCFFGQVFFGGLGVPRPKPTHFHENTGLGALPPSVARPRNHYCLLCVVFWSWYPRHSKKPLGPKTLRDPYDFTEEVVAGGTGGTPLCAVCLVLRLLLGLISSPDPSP